VNETTFCRHRDAVSLRLRRRITMSKNAISYNWNGHVDVKNLQMMPCDWNSTSLLCAQITEEDIDFIVLNTYFGGFLEQILMHFVPFPSVGSVGTEALLISYLIVILLFRWLMTDRIFQFPILPVSCFDIPIPLPIYITIYILINYIVYIRVIVLCFLIGRTGIGRFVGLD